MQRPDRDGKTPLPIAADGRSAGEIASGCARAAAAIIVPAFASERATTRKGRGNVVTEYDLAVERTFSTLLRDAFPMHSILGEETADATPAEGYVWVLDPIDGTKNFASGIPFFCFNLALTFDLEPVLALTLDAGTRLCSGGPVRLLQPSVSLPLG